MALVAALSIVGGAAVADEKEPADKSGYTLFNPAPDDKLRDFSSDRPGKAQSAITVDAGRFQIESDFLNYTYDPRGAGQTTTRMYSIGTPVLKAGVTNWMDVEVGTAIFNRMRTSGPDGQTKASGFGDTTLGAKINVFGNDGGDQSFAFLPVVKFPTAAKGIGNDRTEFTIVAPYTVALPEKFSVTLQPGYGVMRNDANTAYRDEYTFVASVSRPVFVDGLTASIDIALDGSSERKSFTQVSLDPAIAYLVTKNLQLDAGVNIGLNKATPKTQSYVGISYRF
jgi:hypothetical protein